MTSRSEQRPYSQAMHYGTCERKTPHFWEPVGGVWLCLPCANRGDFGEQLSDMIKKLKEKSDASPRER